MLAVSATEAPFLFFRRVVSIASSWGTISSRIAETHMFDSGRENLRSSFGLSLNTTVASDWRVKFVCATLFVSFIFKITSGGGMAQPFGACFRKARLDLRHWSKAARFWRSVFSLAVA